MPLVRSVFQRPKVTGSVVSKENVSKEIVEHPKKDENMVTSEYIRQLLAQKEKKETIK